MGQTHMARVVQIPKREAEPKPEPLFNTAQQHIVAAEKLASFRRGKAWGVFIGACASLGASLIMLAFYSGLDAQSDASAVASATVANRADAVSAEMAGWLPDAR
jgi:hypothetical protein